MKEIGLLLKEKRESSGISLEEVSTSTKINVKILQAIEAGDLERLPAKTFIRGFIQTYAKYLGLNSQDILIKFQDVFGSTRPSTPASTTVPDRNVVEEKFSRTKTVSGGTWFTGAVIVILILGIIFVQKTVSKHEAELKNKSLQVITGNDSPVNLAIPATSVTPSVEATPKETPQNNNTLAVTAPAARSSPQPTPSASPSPSPVAATPVPAKSAPLVTVVPPPPSKPSPSPSPTLAAQPIVENTPMVPQTLIIEALDSVNIKISLDGKPAQDVNMTADQIQTFKAKGKIRLSASNGGAISVIHNGREIGVPGNLGQAKTLSFP